MLQQVSESEKECNSVPRLGYSGQKHQHHSSRLLEKTDIVCSSDASKGRRTACSLQVAPDGRRVIHARHLRDSHRNVAVADLSRDDRVLLQQTWNEAPPARHTAARTKHENSSVSAGSILQTRSPHQCKKWPHVTLS
jgi:hypothetical protein